MNFIKILKDKYNIDLNEQQQEAVLNVAGPTLLLSVPGGGKTTVIVSRIGNMILEHEIDPQKILTLTFSKASALDMEERFMKVFSEDITEKVHFSTIHSFCYRVIAYYTKTMGKSVPDVIEESEGQGSKTNILKQIYLEKNKEYISEDILEELIRSIGYVKNMLFTEQKIKEYEAGINNFFEIYCEYEKYKKEVRLIDYDDMLSGTYKLFKINKEILNLFRERYHYINVDESQDTSLAQHEIIKLLAYPKNNIFMVGDEDQSIYGFRAAFPEALLNFKNTYPGAKVLLMERNYRSTGSIVKPANIFIKQNKERYDKNMYTEREAGKPINFVYLKDKNDLFNHIASSLGRIKKGESIAILYRNNISAISFVDFFDIKGIPFYIKETNIHFFRHWLITDILAFIRLGLDMKDLEAFGQIYYKMNSYISKEMYEYVVMTIGSHKNVFESVLSFPKLPDPTRFKVYALYKNMKRISGMRPFEGIDFIENIISYRTFIFKMCMEKGYSPESLNQVLDSLKIIASKLRTYQELFSRLSYLQDLISSSQRRRYDSVILSTIHSSKGLEFDNVFIVDLIDGQFPSSISISEYEDGSASLMEEEVRLFYVGITRARTNLEIISFSNTNRRKVPISRFVKRLSDAREDKKPGYCDGLSVGARIGHLKFGVGYIKFIDSEKGIMKVEFKNCGEKTMLIEACVNNGLVRLMDEDVDLIIKPDNSKIKSLSNEELRELALDIGKTGKDKELLIELFKHGDYEVRIRACSAAAKLKDREITKHIIPCLYAKESQIRQYALRAILNSDCQEALDDVKDIIDYEDKAYNIALCRHIIRRFDIVKF